LIVILEKNWPRKKEFLVWCSPPTKNYLESPFAWSQRRERKKTFFFVAFKLILAVATHGLLYQYSVEKECVSFKQTLTMAMVASHTMKAAGIHSLFFMAGNIF